MATGDGRSRHVELYRRITEELWPVAVDGDVPRSLLAEIIESLASETLGE